MNTNLREALAHAGVKGMKWGVRKASSSESEDSKRVSGLRSKSVKSMSNDDLKALTTRLQLEQQYASLTTTDSAVKKGKNYVNNVLWGINTVNTITNFAKSPVVKTVIDYALNK